MRFRTSLSSFQVTLLTAMGFGSLSACSSTVISRNSSGVDPVTEAGATGGASGHASGGAPNAGAPTGDASIGGEPSAGAPNSGGAGGSGGGTAGVPSGGAGGAGGSTGLAGMPCDAPVPVTSSVTGMGPSGGYVRCEGGMVHRPNVGECWSNIDPLKGPNLIGPPWPDGSVNYGCRTNADCNAAPHGHCEASQMFGFGGAPSIACEYGCVRDSDCSGEQICLCGDPVGRCVEARCKSDAECATGTLCRMGTVYGVCGPNTDIFACGPLCVTNADCSGGAPFGYRCQGGDCWPTAVCGRPFLIAGEARVADVELRNDWTSSLTPDVASLPLEARRALAEHYTTIGLMEHASVAAFARFSLELLALGAPAELVRLAAAALGDETEHAELCFGLAAAYGGREVGPGPLAVAGALEASSLAEKLRTAFAEACIGETCAAVEAAEAAERATDPAVRAVLRRISADETRHAELGWKFAQWALDHMDASTRAAVVNDLVATVEHELEPSTDAIQSSSSDSEHLVAHGMLPPSLRLALRRATIRDAVAPCLRALSTSLRYTGLECPVRSSLFASS